MGRNIALICFIVLLTYIAFIPALSAGFTNWDDPDYCRNFSFREIFTTSVLCNYHPLTILSLNWNGKSSYPYHLTNVILHILNTILVFFFIYLLSEKRRIVSFLTALFFGIHAMHVESVVWISARKDVLYTFFFLLSLIFYLHYINADKRKISLYLLSFTFFIFSVLSKAMAIPLPLILILIDFYTSARKNNLKGILFEKIPFLAVSITFGIIAIRCQEQGFAVTKFAITLFQRVCFASYGFMVYLNKFWDASSLSTFYPYPSIINGHLPIYYYILPFIGIGILSLVLLSLRKTKIILFGFGFYSLMLIMVLRFIPIGGTIIADRYTYISYIGLVFMIGMMVEYLFESKDKQFAQFKYPVLILLTIFAGYQAYLAYDRCKVWENSETLWKDVISKYDIEPAYINLGIYFLQQKRYSEALFCYLKQEKMNPNNNEIYICIGDLYAVHKDYIHSIEYYNKLLKAKASSEGYYKRGISYKMLGNLTNALSDLLKSKELGFPVEDEIYKTFNFKQKEKGDYRNENHKT